MLAQNCYVLGFLPSSSDADSLTRARWIRLQAALGGVVLPWIVIYLERTVSISGGTDAALVSWIPSSTPDTLLDTFLVYSGYLLNYPFALADPLSRAIATGTLIVFAALSIRAVVSRGALAGPRSHPCPSSTGPNDDGEANRRVDLLFVWLVVPCIVPYTLSYLLTPIYVTRFTIAASGALFLLAARGLACIERDSLRTFVLAVLVIGSLTSVGLYHGATTQEDWRGVGAYLDAETAPDEPVFVAPTWADRPVEYYTSRTGPVISVAPSNARTSLPGPGNGSLAEDGRFWVVVASGHEGASATLDALGPSRVVTDRTSFGTIDVYRVETRRSSSPNGSTRPIDR